MHHEVFGEISYDPDSPSWHGTCALPAFAEYGREPNKLTVDDDENFRNGIFPLSIQDYRGTGPTAQQANAFRYLQQNELAVRQVVLTELLASYHAQQGWAKPEGRSRFWGRVMRWLGAKPYETIEDLKPAARCTAVEISAFYVGDLAYLGFYFASTWEVEHGLTVVYHPEKGAFWGDGIAIADINEADNLDEAYG
jgi:hypothetical protein